MSSRRSLLLALPALAGLSLTAGLAGANENAVVDPSKSERWPWIKENLFGDREVVYDARGEVLEMFIPAAAQDASTVPIIIRAKDAQSTERWIRKIWLVVDKNPSPVGGQFTFYPRSGIANVETRIRVEEYTHIRAIAEDDSGRLVMAARWIRASGGCSAASGGGEEQVAVGKMKFRLDDIIEPGRPTKIQVMVAHPNHSGMAMDPETREKVDAYFVKHVEVTYKGEPVMTADVDFSISQNPNFRFYFTPSDGGELKAEVVDTKDLVYTQSVNVLPGRTVTQ